MSIKHVESQRIRQARERKGKGFDVRNEVIKKLHFESGHTLEYIGGLYSISRERIRQIIGGSKNARKKLVEKLLPQNTPLTKRELREFVTSKHPGIKETLVDNCARNIHHGVEGDSAPSRGEKGERVVFNKLVSLGINSELMPFGHPFDILANGKRVDVKTCEKSSSISKRGKSKYYRFGIRKNKKLECDFFIFYVVPMDMFLVIPIDDLPNVQTAYFRDETSSPRKWRKSNMLDIEKYVNRFDLLQELDQ